MTQPLLRLTASGDADHQALHLENHGAVAADVTIMRFERRHRSALSMPDLIDLDREIMWDLYTVSMEGAVLHVPAGGAVTLLRLTAAHLQQQDLDPDDAARLLAAVEKQLGEVRLIVAHAGDVEELTAQSAQTEHRRLERNVVDSLGDKIRLKQSIEDLLGYLLSEVPGYSGRPTDGVFLQHVRVDGRQAFASGVVVMIEHQTAEPVRATFTLDEAGRGFASAQLHFGDAATEAPYGSRERRNIEHALILDPAADFRWKEVFHRDARGWHHAEPQNGGLKPMRQDTSRTMT